MRIFVFLAEGGDPTFDVLERARDVLRSAQVSSARIGGFINNRAVVLVDPTEAPKAVKVLTRAGLQATSD